MFKKKFLTSFIAIALTIGLIPAAAFADNERVTSGVAFISDMSGQVYTGSAWSSDADTASSYNTVDAALDQALSLASGTNGKDVKVNVSASSLNAPIYSNKDALSSSNTHKITLALGNTVLTTSTIGINVPANMQLAIEGGVITAPTGIDSQGNVSVKSTTINAIDVGIQSVKSSLRAEGCSIKVTDRGGYGIDIQNSSSVNLISGCSVNAATCIYLRDANATVSGTTSSYTSSDTGIYVGTAGSLTIPKGNFPITSSSIGIYVSKGNLTMSGATVKASKALKAERPGTMIISQDACLNGDISCDDLTGFLYGGLYSIKPLDKYIAPNFIAQPYNNTNYPWQVVEDSGVRDDTIVDSTSSISVASSSFADKDKLAVANSFVTALDSAGGMSVSTPSGASDAVQAALTKIAARDSSKYTPQSAITALNNPSYSNPGLVEIHYEPRFTVSISNVDGVYAATMYNPRSVTLDISPTYNVVVHYNGQKTATYLAQNQPFNVDGACSVSMALPEGFASSSESLYVQHYGKVLPSSTTRGSIYLTGINYVTNSFSPFVITKSVPGACIGNVDYATLQDALNEATSGQTITLKANLSSNTAAKVDGSKLSSFIINTDSYLGFNKDTSIVSSDEDYVLSVMALGSTLYRYEVIPRDQASFVVTFEAGEEATPIAPQVEKYGTTLDLSPYTPMRAEYTFGGWYKDSNLTISVTEVEITSDITLYAKWDPITTKRYSDVSENDWFYNEVYKATECDYVHGNGNTNTFAPNKDICRANALIILFNMAGGTKESSSAYKQINQLYAGARFDDVNSTDYFAEAVGWGARMGITTGIGNGDTFDPASSITRQEMAAFIGRYAKLMNKFSAPSNPTQILSTFPDASKVSPWAVEWVSWCAERQIMGRNGELNPAANITRAEVTAMAVRFQPIPLSRA